MSDSEESEFDEDEYETDSGAEEEEEEEVVAAPAPKAAKASKAKAKAPDANPCKNYRVDTKAVKFGDCKCGWAKTDHIAKGENKAAKALRKLQSKSNVATDEPAGSGDSPCQHFRIDVTASSFGMCKCGFSQSDHGETKINPARAALKSLKSVKVTVVKSDHACENYRVDPRATEFGLCHCGFKKADHSEKEEDAAHAMLRRLKEKNKSKHELEDQLAAGGPATGRSGSKASAGLTSGASPSGGGCCIVM